MLKIEKTPLQNAFVVTPMKFEDDRGFFCETWSAKLMAEVGLNIDFVQDNYSLSVDAGTVRGLHFQYPPHAQGKLVRCGKGRLFDAIVDIRKGSPSYGKWFGIELSGDNGRQLWIPEGFLHGFATLEPNTEVFYKCTRHYACESEGVVKWDSCGIDWALTSDRVILSRKDANAQNFDNFESPFTYEVSK